MIAAGLALLLSACFEVKESLHLQYDGSGAYQLALDFSENQQLFEALLKLEDRTGVPVFDPNPFQEIRAHFEHSLSMLEDIKGIHNTAQLSPTEHPYVFGYSFQFENLLAFNQALALFDSKRSAVYWSPYYQYKKGKLTRESPFYLQHLMKRFSPSQIEKSPRATDTLSQILEKARYRFIFTTPGNIKKVPHPQASISPRKDSLVVALPYAALFSTEAPLQMRIKFKRP